MRFNSSLDGAYATRTTRTTIDMTNASFSGGTALIQLDRGCGNDDDHDSVYQIRCGQVILINYVICTATGGNFKTTAWLGDYYLLQTLVCLSATAETSKN